MPLLDRLDDVPWSGLHHAYGPAEDVPGLLRELLDPAGREKAMYELWGNVFHQGTRWQASASVVPFLVEILRDGPPHPDLREFLITYLHHLALGYPHDLFPLSIDPPEYFREADDQVDPGGEPAYDGETPVALWARNCYEAVEAGLVEIARFLDSECEAVSLEAIVAAASFPRRREDTVSPLRSLAKRADLRGAHAAISLAMLEGAPAQDVAEALVEDPNPLVGIHGACAAVLADPTRVSQAITLRLTEPFEEPAEGQSRHTGSLRVLVGRCLTRLGDEHCRVAVEALARQHVNAAPMAGLSLTESLLVLVFGEEPAPPEATQLTPDQRFALVAIRDHGAFTLGGNVFANYGNLLRGWGLPSTQEALAEWLADD